ncbi:hypothetical protein MCOR25_005091 [Pyricularia grisea]|uniref:Uncharacterized protein n=1 Tax=Pyricularia grisea TaxID=148305 RepID=A0A6P8BFB5_PYRGI|nr:uncharacterized protein PgNI_00305 [Pyricularia grisea]KAI6366725.1 hypothetical protein MCOR25_005091 [Pyricularia grisea]TLD15478.1 hypothetical protein PgNI_00305 [Pyricularia grisea]
MSTPTWLITGASSGFGEAIAKEALSRGHTVIATARSANSLKHLAELGAKTMALDVTASDAELASKMAEIGRVTHVLNTAGYLLEAAVEEATAAESEAIYRTNVLGAVNITKAAMPGLRAVAAEGAAGGVQPVVAHFGSLGSWIGGAAAAHYCSTKWAVSGLCEGIRDEVAEFGIAACAIEPGYFRTEILNTASGKSRRVQASEPKTDVYGEDTAVGKYKAALEAYNNKQPGDVVKGAKVTVDVLTKTGVAEGKEIPPRLVLGSDVVDVIRKKCQDTLKLLEEWEDIAKSTDYE